MRQVICAVEVSWRGMRECSVALASTGAEVQVLIKGDVPPEVLAMISPKPHITIRDVSVRRFAWRLAGQLLQASGGPAERVLIVNKPKTQRWTSWVGRLRGWRVLRLVEADTGFRLYDTAAREAPVPWSTPPPDATASTGQPPAAPAIDPAVAPSTCATKAGGTT